MEKAPCSNTPAKTLAARGAQIHGQKSSRFLISDF